MYPANPIVFSEKIIVRKGKLKFLNNIGVLAILLPNIIAVNLRRVYSIDIG